MGFEVLKEGGEGEGLQSLKTEGGRRWENGSKIAVDDQRTVWAPLRTGMLELLELHVGQGPTRGLRVGVHG